MTVKVYEVEFLIPTGFTPRMFSVCVQASNIEDAMEKACVAKKTKENTSDLAKQRVEKIIQYIERVNLVVETDD